MDPNTFPTKGNLILAKNTLRLSAQGYELLDKKRNVLIREIMEFNKQAQIIQRDIERVFREAYTALQEASIQNGVFNVEQISYGMPEEESVRIRQRSVMGVEIPTVTYENATRGRALYGMENTSISLDIALEKFNAVKDLVIQLAEVENSAYRLAINIRKTQKRANALKNVTIPKYTALVKLIQETLEERERDEFTRLKVLKKKK
jgi:V/A-type H+-transporting ATPase subunit D